MRSRVTFPFSVRGALLALLAVVALSSPAAFSAGERSVEATFASEVGVADSGDTAVAGENGEVEAGQLAPTLTFEGSAAGGTIRLTTTADRSTIVAAAVVSVAFPGCSTDSGAAYIGPPAPVADGAFEFSYSFRHPIHGFTFSGSFAGENTIQGTIRNSFFISGFSCSGGPIPWTLTGPAKTAPGPDDQSFIDPAAGGSGSITIMTDPSATQITALVLESVPVAPCAKEVSAIVPLTSAVPIAPADSSFEVGFSLGRMQSVGVSGTLDGQTAQGTLSFFDGIDACSGSVEWAATRKGAPVGGIALEPDVRALPRNVGDEHQVGRFLSLTAIAGMVALGGAAWYVRRRRRS